MEEVKKNFESAINDCVINRSMLLIFKDEKPGAYVAPHIDEEE